MLGEAQCKAGCQPLKVVCRTPLKRLYIPGIAKIPPSLKVEQVRKSFPVFRALATDDQDDDLFLEGLKSSYELGSPPRMASAEAVYRTIHMGISCYDNAESAAYVGKSFALGEFVAKLELRPDQGITYARWGSHGHLTVWAEAIKLKAALVDIFLVTDFIPED